jgi:peptidoglycan/LPS O-acetylase OafA/YrhL
LSVTLQVLHPLFAVAGIGVVMAAGTLVSRVAPFYRRELNVEALNRLAPLDGLRGILCFAVLLHHAAVTCEYLQSGIWSQPTSAVYALLGSVPVALFFCLTGFLFWSRAMASAGQLDAVPFLRARFFRIVPLYAFSCAVVIVLVGRRVHWLSYGAVRGLLQMGLMGLRPWRSLGSVDLMSVNAAVTWTLRYEWAFYLALPALALAARPRALPYVLLLAFAMFLIFGNGYYFYFLPGMLAAYAARSPKVARTLQRPQVAPCVLALVIVLPLLTHDGYGYGAELFVSLIFIPIACGNDLFGLLSLKGLRLLGMVSYSVYLLHGLGLYIARPLLIHATPAGGGSAMKYWVCIYAVSLAVLLVSLLTYRWIEWPSIRFERRLRGSRGRFLAPMVTGSLSPRRPILALPRWRFRGS